MERGLAFIIVIAFALAVMAMFPLLFVFFIVARSVVETFF